MHNPDVSIYDYDDAYTYTIEEGEASQRIDRFVASLLENVSRTSVQQIVVDGGVLVNGRTCKPSYLLRVGDEVCIAQTTAKSTRNASPCALPLKIVYEDKDLLVINKAAGMVVHPSPGHVDDTLVNAVLAYYPDLQHTEGLRPGVVHRLDRDTSGLIIVAKNARTQAALIEQMRRHEIVKRYLALVEGVVSVDSGSIDAPIGRDPRHRRQMAVTATGSKDALTYFRVLERFQRHTLLLLQLETGRTHQIRVHLKAIGHPIVGDPVYGSGKMSGTPSLSRQFLHAFQLNFTHPTTGKALELEAPLPEDLTFILLQKSSL